MMGFIWRLIVGRFRMAPSCAHKWVQVHAVNVYDYGVSKNIPVAHKYTLRCEHCGDMKVFKT